MVSKIWNNCPDVAQVLKIVYEVQTVLHNHIIYILKIADQVVEIATYRGKGVAWTFMEAFSSFALLLASCHNDGFKRGKTNINAGESKTYCKCKIAGCPKVLRAVTFFCGIPEEDAQHRQQFSTEHDTSALHEHSALELPIRGNATFFYEKSAKLLENNRYHCRNLQDYQKHKKD